MCRGKGGNIEEMMLSGCCDECCVEKKVFSIWKKCVTLQPKKKHDVRREDNCHSQG